LAQREPTSHLTRTPLSRSKGQLVADVLNSQHAGTDATWRINTKILSTCRGWRHIVSPRAQLVIVKSDSFTFYRTVLNLANTLNDSRF